METKLKEKDLLLNAIVDHVPLGLFVKDLRNGMRFVLWNKVSEQIYGATQKEVLGRSAHDIFDREVADFFFKVDRRVASEGSVVEVPEQTLTSKNLGEVVLRTLKVPIAGVDGKPQLLLGISENITPDKIEQNEVDSDSLEIEKLRRALISVESKAAKLEEKLALSKAPVQK